jgi:hypothetical protein
VRLATIVADIADHLPKEDPSKGKAGHHCSGYTVADHLPKEDPSKGEAGQYCSGYSGPSSQGGSKQRWVRLATIVADIADHLPKEDPSKGEAGHHCSGYSGPCIRRILAKERLASIVVDIEDHLPKEDPSKGEAGHHSLSTNLTITCDLWFLSINFFTSGLCFQSSDLYVHHSDLCPLLSTSPMTSAFNPYVLLSSTIMTSTFSSIIAAVHSLASEEMTRRKWSLNRKRRKYMMKCCFSCN